MQVLRWATVFFLVLAVTAEDDDHEGHDHGGDGHDHGATDDPWEWAGMFATPESIYTWTAQKKDGKYADPAMKMVILKGGASTEAVLHGLEAEAKHGFEAACTDTLNGATIVPAEDACYMLKFDEDTHTTVFKIDTTGADAIGIFTAHHPIEFERCMHFFKDDHGDDIEADAELPVAEPEPAVEKPWGVSIGACFLVNICTFIGILFLVPFFGKLKDAYPNTVFALVNAFAAGAILSAAFYLMLYEATHLIPIKDSEAEACAYWGSMILIGFFAANVIDILVSALHCAGSASTSPDTASSSSTEKELEVDPSAVAPFKDRIRVLSGVLVGDFMHNFVDGIVIATAFLGCSSSKAWGITAATVAHELAQELADYLVLTDPKQGGLKPFKALLFNFVSGLSVMIGAVAVLAQDSIDYESQGFLLAFGGGVYVQIGAAEAMPRANQLAKSVLMKVSTLATFLFGAFAIGIVLVSHEHCNPGGGDGDGHAHGGGGDGHNHGR